MVMFLFTSLKLTLEWINEKNYNYLFFLLILFSQVVSAKLHSRDKALFYTFQLGGKGRAGCYGRRPALERLYQKLQGRFQVLHKTHKQERAELFKGMNRQYQKIERQKEIRQLFEKEKGQIRQNIKDDYGHEPEL